MSRAREIFDEAADRPRSQRAALVDATCAGDEELRRDVLSLLASLDEASAFLERPAVAEDDASSEMPDTEPAPSRIGPYEVVREIGRGGMGTVYLAVGGGGDFEKRVAIKVVKRGMDTDFFIQRFRNERRILAGLDHPFIARLYDGGATEGGRPYLVMEYVEGRDLLGEAEARPLGTRERLQLFRSVCEAVQYAHQNLVVHRDIKPGNILVTADGTPKLLDFGLAKLVDPAEAPEGGPALTATAFRMLTPEYASPEQVKGERITTASDVYSLGVVLYRLLTGEPPYRLGARTPSDIARAVLEQDPPSRRSGLPPDLAAIVRKAMRKEPHERYASAEQLSEDIGRHLAGRPVLARKGTFQYRTAKFVRRNRIGVAAALLVTASLLGGLFAATWQAGVARRERSRAEKRFDQVRELARSNLFELYDAILYLPGSTAARALLVKRALRYLNGLAAEAAGDVGLQRELAEAYLRVANVQAHSASASLGDTAGARRSTFRALALREELARANPDNAEDQSALAEVYGQVSQLLEVTGDRRGSLAAARKSVALRERLTASGTAEPERRRELAISVHFLAGALDEAGDHAESLSSYSREEDIFRDLLKEDPRNARFRWGLVCALEGIAEERRSLGQPRTALEALREALSVTEGLVRDKPDHATLLRGLGEITQGMGDCERELGDLGASVSSQRRALALRERQADRDPQNADARSLKGQTMCRLGRTLVEAGAVQEGIGYLRKAQALFERDSAADPLNVGLRAHLAETLLNLGVAERSRRRTPQAGCDAFRRSRDLLAPLAATGHLSAANEKRYAEVLARIASCDAPAPPASVR